MSAQKRLYILYGVPILLLVVVILTCLQRMFEMNAADNAINAYVSAQAEEFDFGEPQGIFHQILVSINRRDNPSSLLIFHRAWCKHFTNAEVYYDVETGKVSLKPGLSPPLLKKRSIGELRAVRPYQLVGALPFASDLDNRVDKKNLQPRHSPGLCW